MRASHATSKPELRLEIQSHMDETYNYAADHFVKVRSTTDNRTRAIVAGPSMGAAPSVGAGRSVVAGASMGAGPSVDAGPSVATGPSVGAGPFVGASPPVGVGSSRKQEPEPGGANGIPN